MAGPSEEEYLEFFRDADVDNSGSLSLTELTEVFKKKGHREDQIKDYFKSVDLDGNNQISENEFLQAMGCVPPDQKKGAAMRMVFREFDRDGNGQVEKSELKEMFVKMGKHFSDRELTRMIELMDADGSGCVDYEEFIQHFCGK